MLMWASLDRSIWALVAGSIVSNIVRVALSHATLSGPSNKWQWERGALGEILGFGKWIFVSSILGFFAGSGDRLLLGGLVSSTTLGLYSIAFLIMSACQNALVRLVAQVGLPALSEVAREDQRRLKKVYYRFRMPVDAVALLLAGFLFVSGSSIVKLLFDPRYSGAGPILQILALFLVFVRYEVAHQCYYAVGRPKLATAVTLIDASALYLSIPLAFHYFGFHGAVWAIALACVASLPLDIWITAKLGLLDIKKEFVVMPVFLLGMAIGELLVLVAR